MIKPTYNRIEFDGKETFIGRVKVYENGKYLYSHSCGINRITREDALEDAGNLAHELITEVL